MDHNLLLSQIKGSAGLDQYLQELLDEAYKEERSLESSNASRKLLNENKDLLYSIKNMQNAIMPYSGRLSELFSQSFIYSEPKENVSGDFYWVEQLGEKIFIASGDCKVNGVTGAVMSIIFASTLNRVIHEFGISDTGKMLDKAQELMAAIFKDSDSGKEYRISISLCCINKRTCVLEWSGANSNLFYVHNGIMEEMIGNKEPISDLNSPFLFAKHKMFLSKQDMIYLYTDGYTNQLGGENNEKLICKCFQETLIKIAPLGVRTQQELLQKKFETWKGDLEQTDDVLIIGLRL